MLIGVAVIVVALLVVTLSTLFTVHQSEQALVLQFGKIQRTVQEPGLHVKMPFVENVEYFDRLSDRIAVVHQGRLEQVGTPVEVYERPANSFVGEFLGRTVVLEGRVKNNGEIPWIELLQGGGGLVMKDDLRDKFSDGEQVRVISRPEDIDILPRGQLSKNQIAAKVEEVAYLGDRFEYSVSVGKRTFVLSAGKRERLTVGAEIRIAFDPEHLTVLSL